jgi:hypothetical protein
MAEPDETKPPSLPATPGDTLAGRVAAATLVSVLCGGLGVAASWVQAQNPLFGVPIDDPSSVALIAAFAVIGFVGTLARGGRRPARPPGGLHDEVKRLVDAGEKARAIALHRDLTGDGPAAAEEAVEGYLAHRP